MHIFPSASIAYARTLDVKASILTLHWIDPGKLIAVPCENFWDPGKWSFDAWRILKVASSLSLASLWNRLAMKKLDHYVIIYSKSIE